MDESCQDSKQRTKLPEQGDEAFLVRYESACQDGEHLPKTKQLIDHQVQSPEPRIGDDELADYRRLRDELTDWMKKTLHPLP